MPNCAAPNIYLVLASGVLACQARYVDNGDGTVTDNQTGLMWEKKTGTVNPSPVANAADVHDVNNTYAWTGTSLGTAADGDLFTRFLAILNLDASSSGSATCFANHCDWRIPNIMEVQSILLAPNPCGTYPCIDPIFGPAQASTYWSSTTFSTVAGGAWFVYFTDGSVNWDNKQSFSYARAVRSGR